MARPIGDGGVSTISSAAGRKASSARERLALVEDMDSCLQFVESCVAAGRAHEFVVRAVLDEAPSSMVMMRSACARPKGGGR